MVKNSQKQLLREFEERMQRIAEATASGVNAYESESEKAARIQKLLNNYEQFCYYYFPNYCSAKMAKFQKQSAKYLAKNWNQVALIQWFREGAKSTHYNCMYPIWQLMRGELTGMMGGSANEDLAIRLMMDIKANLEGNQRLINDFGEQKSYGNWEMDKFVTNQGIGFFAFGANQSPRGTRFGHRRPNYGTIDDLNDKKSLKNDAISREQFEWVKEDFMAALSTKRWQLVIPQNKFHKNTVTALFEADHEVKTYISRVNMLNDAGESNWPEYFSTDECKAKIQSVGHLSAQREYFNNPVEEGTVFKRENIHFVKRLPWKNYDALVQYSDPSYKNNQKSDYKATVLIGKKGREFHILKVFLDRVSITDMFLWCYELDALVEDRALIRHWMEANFIQDMHFKALEPLEKDKGYRLRISGDQRAKPDKFQRISSLEPLFENGLIKFSQSEKDNPHMNRLIDQFLGFEKGSNINDDGPDAVEGAIYKLEEMTVQAQPPIFVQRKRSRFAF